MMMPSRSIFKGFIILVESEREIKIDFMGITRKHSSRMRTDRNVTSDRVANKDEQ